MKNLCIVIHSGVQQTLADTLRSLDQVKNFTFTQVEGHSHYREDDPLLSARDKVVGYIPRVRVDILLASTDVDGVLAKLVEQNNLRKQGVYWVMDVERHGWF